MGRIDELMKQVKNFQKASQNTKLPEANNHQSSANSTKQAVSKI
jgi:hypothetical protein